MTLKERKVKK